MPTLHAFGCSITQGFALPDTIQPLTHESVRQLGRAPHWSDIHLYKPSEYAWPQILGSKLGYSVENHARRGACTEQIARQCAAALTTIKPGDLVIVMWTYLTRVSYQWPARTSVPFSNLVDTTKSWRTLTLPGFNKFFGLTPSTATTDAQDRRIHEFIHAQSIATVSPMGIYNKFYNNLVLQTMVHGTLAGTGSPVIHLSVEPEPYLDQLERARLELDTSLREPYVIPDPRDWYRITVDHDLCRVIHDPSIPPAKNDTHPSEQHHLNFALSVYDRYFR